jgi:carboxypeptidase Taq
MGDPSLDASERAYLRVLRRAYDRETKLPADLVVELARETSLSQAVWIEARAKNDFPAFAPRLERMVELKKRQAACLADGRIAAGTASASYYDALLDLYEPGSTEASVAAVFALLRKELVALLGRIRSRPQVDDSFLHRPCAARRQAAISEWIMGIMSYDLLRGRLDTVAHPFTTTLGGDDVRITTRYIEDFFVSSLFSTVHEAGHALYELGIAPGREFTRTRLHDAASMAVHESQSRLWENMVGRSRAFWKPMYAHLVGLAGAPLEGVDLDAFARAINKVEPSLIRTEADEVTYGLHVILRFELEAELISGTLSVKDLPAAWNAKMMELIGIAPPDDTRGCLQDVHWSGGMFGYFPSYALGNLYPAQFWSAMKREMPDLDDRIESGDIASVLGWLRAKVHAPGAIYRPDELVQRVTGSSLDPKYFVAYLNEKYSRVYGF